MTQPVHACRLTSAALAALILAACDTSTIEDDGFVIDEAPRAVVTTQADDFTSGAHALVDIEAPYTTTGNLDAGESDISVTTAGEHLYKLRRFNLDTITKYSLDAPATPIWQFSTLDADDETSANPYDLAFAAVDKAYLLRYGQPDAWIVDPSVTAEADFKRGELDLSAYSPNASTNPNMTRGIVVDGKLFIAMQRFDDSFTAYDAYVAVFDTSTDTEINTSQDPILGGIPLPVRNPLTSDDADLIYDASLGLIYVVAPGSSSFDPDTFESTPNYDGGLVTIDPVTYETTLLIDDSATTGQISDLVIINEQLAYVISSAGFGNNSLYRIDPRTGAFLDTDGGAPQPVAGLGGTSLTALTADIGQRLWVGRGDGSNPGITILDTLDDAVVQTLIPLSRNPARIEFTNQP